MTTTPAPDTAVLFWYYRDLPVCMERLQLLRRLNPGLPVYGLFGGSPGEFAAYRAALAPLLDDNWAFPEDWDAQRKWRHGDQMLSAWHLARGGGLAWQRIMLMQWDMLALTPLEGLLARLGRDEIYLPGLRPMHELEPDWWWVRPGSPQGEEYVRFKAHMADRHGYAGPHHGCQFITAVLPRTFLDAYAGIDSPELGFLEYKLPAYAAAFGVPFGDIPALRVSWPGRLNPQPRRRIVLTAEKREIGDRDIAMSCLHPGAARLFHPVSRAFETQPGWLARLIGREVLRTLGSGRRRQGRT